MDVQVRRLALIPSLISSQNNTGSNQNFFILIFTAKTTNDLYE